MLKKLTIQPGANREPTNYSSENAWWDMDKVRFRYGYPEKIGGWTLVTSTATVGVPRALLQWVALDGADYLACGTSKKLYVESGQVLFDVTPIREVATISNPFTTQSGMRTVVVTDNSHGAVYDDYVTISGVTATLNGIPAADFNREHRVTSIVDVNTYTIEVATAATSTGTPVAANVVFSYQINVGLDVAITGTGWGTGPWSRGGWGSAFSAGLTSQLRLWSLTNFGEDIIASVYNGGIYYWDTSGGVGTRAYLLSAQPGASAVPSVATVVTVTEDRHVVAFGANPITGPSQDKMLVRWSTQENALDWSPTATNTAGDYRLTIGSRIIAVERARNETLIWTDSALYSMRFSGPPFTFAFNLIAQNVSIVGANAAVDVAGKTFWMGVDKFYAYTGQVETLVCPLFKYVFNNFNTLQSQQVVAGSFEANNEVWWFYPSASSDYPDKYVIYNYVEGTWAFGNMQRTAWIDSKERGYPIATDMSQVFYQEFGIDDQTDVNNPQPIAAFVESSDFDLDDGDKLAFVKRIIPDISFEGSTSSTPWAMVELTTRIAPGGNYYRQAGMPVIRSVQIPYEQFTTQAWVRLRGRQMKLKVSTDQLGVTWHLGAVRVDVQPDGSNGRNV